MKHSMKVIDGTGHSTVEWDTEVHPEVLRAEREFDRLLAEGRTAIRTDKPGEGEIIKKFDPEADVTIIAPLAGG